MSKTILSVIKLAASRMARWGALGTASSWLFYEPKVPPALRKDD